MRSLHFILSFVTFINSIIAQLPVYEYLKELCPSGLTVMTREDRTIKCSEICPSGGVCIKGVCCRNASIARCHSTIFRYSIGLACILNDPNSCPPGTRCKRTTIFSIHLCCSESAELSICPGTHPIPQLTDGTLTVCNSETTCRKGLCVSYGLSSRSFCCQTAENLCGTNSRVELVGSVPRTCSQRSPLCSRSYVCTNSKASQGICCSLPKCSDGQRAKRRCKTTCPRGQRCTKIGNANWCCKLPSICSSLGNRESVGDCRRESDCATGFTCKEYQNPSGISRCCVEKPRCPDSTTALIRHGKVVQCFIHGSPCMTAGYSCQRATDSSLQCCSIMPLLAECPQRYRGAMSIISGGFIPCSDRFDFTCPPGYSCIPSATTEQHLCCAPESSDISVWSIL